MSAGLQGSASGVIDLSVGSVLRALMEACASVALWMQWLILQVLSMTRAATSVGSDLDSWMADFSLVRLPGARSRGDVVFGRYATSLQATIPVGAVVRTVDGSQSFAVIADQSNPAWDGQSGYAAALGIAEVTLPVQALVPGAIGNVVAGSVGLLGSAIPGVDYVDNPVAFFNGVDAESDGALRSRFILFVNSRSLATVDAVGASIQGLQQGLRYCVTENVDRNGLAQPGNFCVVVDDGTGSASDALLTEVNAAVDLVRPIGSTYSVSGPVIADVAVAMTISTLGSVSIPTTVAAVQQAILIWIRSLPMGATLAISKLEAIAHATSNDIISVVSTTLNGVSVDITAKSGTVFVTGPINVVTA